MNTTTLPAPGNLSQLCAVALRANGELMDALLKGFPQARMDDLQRLLSGGGSVGIETTVDRNALMRVFLVGLEREGNRLVLAEVSTSSGQSPAGHGILAPEPRGVIH